MWTKSVTKCTPLCNSIKLLFFSLKVLIYFILPEDSPTFNSVWLKKSLSRRTRALQVLFFRKKVIHILLTPKLLLLALPNGHSFGFVTRPIDSYTKRNEVLLDIFKNSEKLGDSWVKLNCNKCCLKY